MNDTTTQQASQLEMTTAVSLDAAKHAYEAGALTEDLTSRIVKLKETQNLPFLGRVRKMAKGDY